MTFTVLVCGGRDYMDFEKIHNALANLCDKKNLWGKYEVTLDMRPATGLCVVTGGAPGADRIASEWALVNRAALKVHHAEWDKYGLRAGPIRNAAMLSENKIDLVLAAPGGTGTRDMISRARKAGIEVRQIR